MASTIKYKKGGAFNKILLYENTVKSVLKGHLWNKEKVASKDR
jgi:hypothetical protein